MEETTCHVSTMQNSSSTLNWTRPKYCSALTPWEDYVVATYLIIADLVAIPLNTMVICLMYRLRHSLSACDYFIVNLALSDLGHPLLGYPMSIAAAFSHRWTLGEIGCSVNGFLGFFFGVTSMTTLGVMSIVRYVTVARPNLVQGNVRCKVYISLFLIQSYSLFWAITPLAGWGMYDIEQYGLSCTLKWRHPNKSYLVSSFVFCLTLPVAAMAFSYFSITHISNRTRKRMLRWKQNPRASPAWSKQDFRLLKMSIIMLFVFVLAWTPYAIVSMVESFVPDVVVPLYLSLFPALCAKLSHILDPLIYFGMNKKFQRLAKSLFVSAPFCDVEQTPSSELPFRTPTRVSVATYTNQTIQMKAV